MLPEQAGPHYPYSLATTGHHHWNIRERISMRSVQNILNLLVENAVVTGCLEQNMCNMFNSQLFSVGSALVCFHLQLWCVTFLRPYWGMLKYVITIASCMDGKLCDLIHMQKETSTDFWFSVFLSIYEVSRCNFLYLCPVQVGLVTWLPGNCKENCCLWKLCRCDRYSRYF